jgi:hypothetical protein
MPRKKQVDHAYTKYLRRSRASKNNFRNRSAGHSQKDDDHDSSTDYFPESSADDDSAMATNSAMDISNATAPNNSLASSSIDSSAVARPLRKILQSSYKCARKLIIACLITDCSTPRHPPRDPEPANFQAPGSATTSRRILRDEDSSDSDDERIVPIVWHELADADDQDQPEQLEQVDDQPLETGLEAAGGAWGFVVDPMLVPDRPDVLFPDGNLEDDIMHDEADELHDDFDTAEVDEQSEQDESGGDARDVERLPRYVKTKWLAKGSNDSIYIAISCRTFDANDGEPQPADELDVQLRRLSMKEHLDDLSVQFVMEKAYHKLSHEAMASIIKLINANYASLKVIIDGNVPLPSFRTMRRTADENLPKVLIIAAWRNLENEDIVIDEPSNVSKQKPKDKYKLLYEISYVKVCYRQNTYN